MRVQSWMKGVLRLETAMTRYECPMCGRGKWQGARIVRTQLKKKAAKSETIDVARRVGQLANRRRLCYFLSSCFGAPATQVSGTQQTYYAVDRF